ncbi:hypothetical protein [Blastococcus sp. PRF04-17]|uniref:hypothetical protein n=1 Tax=Blastococcus sp. PRF04-17 TaxID=2933797 RepID=UPI001FF6382B|nr:hypothetical protein [Blastococcus sp. PRF04-17]UOY01019.1 hypothetical protein MVA48_18905 [Blastococcus sp. PRF04-17]
MVVELPPIEVYGLANALRAAARVAEEIGPRLGSPGDVGEHLSAAVDNFLESHRTAGRALAGELQWLGDTVAAVADSWLRLDAAVVPAAGRADAR